ncbi:MAG: hypothetical protein M1817_001406 [Caeruleum heppii]|nr:MAG: hypothetical protein M1817_001406 [Caeruleum heppii]
MTLPPRCLGSTSTVSRIELGVLLKSPLETDHPTVAKQVKLAFSVEPPILQRLGSHPRIVTYLGRRDGGLLLGEASHGTLQAYLDANHPSIRLPLRKKWCRQSAEALAHVHSRGIIHSDLRPENFLVHERTPGCLDLLLCDFGGAVCDDLGLDGRQLPNDPFYDHTQGVAITPALDIFSLGSVLYTILTGYWPYRTRHAFGEDDDYLDYVDTITELFGQSRYPDVTGLVGGDAIMGCWTKRYATAQEVSNVLSTQLSPDDVHQHS